MKVKSMSRSTPGRLIAVLAMVFTVAWSIPSWGQAAKPMPDLDISDAVEDELAFDQAVTAALINVNTNDGIVHLSGVVDNLLAKERATRIAETVKGVRAVVNTIKVVPANLRKDSSVQRDVERRLVMDAAADAFEIDVSVSEGRVTLSGEVQSWQERSLCETIAKGVRGVVEVDNRIDVVLKTNRPDMEIRAEIERALDWNAFVDDAMIDVAVSNGEVILSGYVGSAAEKSRARAVAHVAGVSGVATDDLKIGMEIQDQDLRKHKYVARTDDQIRQAVKDAFLYDPRVNTFDIEVAVENGRVTLRGQVDNVKSRRAAKRDALNTKGVTGVVNRLKVRPRGSFRDGEVESHIQASFDADPVLSNYDLSIVSIHGVVDLYGKVDTYFEKAEAEETATGVNGVVAVDNNIVVSKAYDPFPYDPYVDTWRIYDFDWYHRPSQDTDDMDSLGDARLKEEIKDELFWSPFVDADQVKVTVDDGIATLKGEVDSWVESHVAVENAYEGGARAVLNELAVNRR